MSQLLWFRVPRHSVEARLTPPFAPLGLWDVMDAVVFVHEGHVRFPC